MTRLPAILIGAGLACAVLSSMPARAAVVQGPAVQTDSGIAAARALADGGDVKGAVEAYLAAATALRNADRIDEAATVVEAAVALSETVAPLGALARLRQDQGRYDDALTLLDRALAVADGDPVKEGQLRYDQAKAYDSLGRNEEAEVAARASYDLRRVNIGQVHEKTADALNLYANALSAQGRHAEADPAYRQVLGMYEVLYGPKDFHLAIVLSNLGNSLRRTGRGRQANPLYRRAVSVAEVSGDKVLLAQCLTNYGWYLHTQGDGRKSEAMFRRALTLALDIVGPDHPFTGVVRANIGYALADQGKYAEAEVAFAEGQRLLEAGLGADSPDIVDTLAGHADVLAALDRSDEAEALYRRVRAITTSRLAPAHPDTLGESSRYARFLLTRDRPGDALGELRTSLAALIGREGGGRDWRTSVRGAGPLFERRVEASWRLAAEAPPSAGPEIAGTR
ncbi:tetratricopeptide repeat protein [Brevundimonas sp.]|jgi:tetratricopeptide (TPR) repeat protein|uniref:tetratricopeptide repeat protein n=1 Tax=Brevundimonas sp. TaxID=1871086 RepID=UPI003784984D